MQLSARQTSEGAGGDGEGNPAQKTCSPSDAGEIAHTTPMYAQHINNVGDREAKMKTKTYRELVTEYNESYDGWLRRLRKETAAELHADFTSESDESRCPRCGRPLRHWATERGGRPFCSPADWAHCVRGFGSEPSDLPDDDADETRGGDSLDPCDE